MRLTYIWHDCFYLEAENADILFDFWKDVCAPVGQQPLFLRTRDWDRPLYVMVSHHHKDHYDRVIFEWAKLGRVHYILSDDTARFARHILNPGSIYKGTKPAPGQVTVLKTGDVYDDGVIRVEAYGSTDIGNSYWFSVDGFSGFHAGDLNAWIWKDESTAAEVAQAFEAFNRIVGSIRDSHPHIDYVMFPVDSRIGTDYFTGAAVFVREIDVARFFPMHFGLGDTVAEQERYRLDAAKTDLYMNPERGEYICLQAPYSSYADPRATKRDRYLLTDAVS